jgi:hypothetical protein
VWPSGIVYYDWDYTTLSDAGERSAIRAAMDEWEDVSANTIEFRRDPNRTTKILLKRCIDGRGNAQGYEACSSGADCTARLCVDNAAHELGHMIGFQHHHQRQDRDHYIRINNYDGCTDIENTARCSRPNVSDFGPFDYKSTMLYAPTDPDIERWDQSPICESLDGDGGCINGPGGPRGSPTQGDGAAAVELYRAAAGYPKFQRMMNVNDPSPYTRFQSPFDENLASGVRISSTASPALETWGGASLAVYLRGTDNRIYKKFYDTGTRQWSTTWEGLGRPSGTTTISDPGVVSWIGGRTDVVVRGGSNIHIMSTPIWGTWQSLGAPPSGAASAPAITSFGVNHLDVFVRATDNRIYHKWCGSNCSGSAGGWSGWEVLGTGTFRGKPAVVARGSSAIELFGHGMDGRLWQMRFGSTGWGSWNQLPMNGTLRFDSSCPDCSSPAAGSRYASNVDVYIRGEDNKLWWASWSGQAWSSYSPLGGVLNSSPATITRLRGSERADIVVVMAEERSAGAAKHHGTWWKQFGAPP